MAEHRWDVVDVDVIAQRIRLVDGANTLGAGPLAEQLLPLVQELVDRARAEVAATASEAMSPFARLADEVYAGDRNASTTDDTPIWGYCSAEITHGDLRRLAAFEPLGGKSE